MWLTVRKFVYATVLLALMSLPALGSSWNASGRWEAQTMGANIKADIQQQGDQISGVAKVYTPMGKKVTYHFSGVMQGNHISAAHHTGHRFTGDMVSPGRIAGVLRTRDGHNVSITASRR
jgi:hypothetical protein